MFEGERNFREVEHKMQRSKDGRVNTLNVDAVSQGIEERKELKNARTQQEDWRTDLH